MESKDAESSISQALHEIQQLLSKLNSHMHQSQIVGYPVTFVFQG